MAKATGKKPTSNLYSLLLEEQPDSVGAVDTASKSVKGKKTDPVPAVVPAVEESKKVAEKQQSKKQPTKAETTTNTNTSTTEPANKPKLSREEWEKTKGQGESKNNQPVPDGFTPVARPPKQYNNNQPAQTGQNYGQDGGYRGGRGGDYQGGRGGEYRGGRRGRGGDYQGGRGGDYQGGRGGDYQGGRGGDYQGGRVGNYQGGRGGDYQGGRSGEYQGGRSGEYRGGRSGEYHGGRGGDYQGRGGEYQGGRGGDYQGRGGRRGGRGRGGRGRNPNANLEDQPNVEENANRDVNQRGEDLTGDKTPRKRQNDRRSGRFVKNYGNNNTGPDFAPSEWTTSTPGENTTTEPTTAEGWGDNTTNTEDPNAAWDAVDKATSESAPSQPASAESSKPAPKKPQEKPKPAPQKGLDDYLAEKQKKNQELADLLASKNVNVPTPKVAAPVEEPKTTKAKQPAKPTPTPTTQVLSSLFNFDANRPLINQFSEVPDDPPPGYENTSRGRGGRRGGRGGRSRGGGRYHKDNYGAETAAQVVAQPTQYYDASSVTREDEWPTLV